MGGTTRTIRLLVGLGMIGAGTTLAAPAGLHLAARWQAHESPTAERGPLPPPAVRSAPLISPRPAPAATSLSPRQERPSAPAGRPHPTLPSPPERLPPVAGAATMADPDLQGTYRSTLDVPPPPLLDAQRPPPVAVGRTAVGPSRRGRPAPRPQAASTWRVRDGDDLNAIASRVYGTPLAATAIWEANRRILPDPRLLPIGVEIVLPPAAAIWPARGEQASIEPAPGGPVPVRPVGGRPAAAWLPRGLEPVAGAAGG